MSDTPDNKIIGLRLLTYGEDSHADIFGDVVTFAPDALYVTQAVPLLHEHDKARVAAGVVTGLEVDDTGAVTGSATLLHGAAGGYTAAVELAADLRTDLSVGVHVDEADYVERDDIEPHPLFGPAVRAHIRRAELVEVSRVWRGRMPSAQIVHNPYASQPEEGDEQ